MRCTYLLPLLATFSAVKAASIDPRATGTTTSFPSWEVEPFPGEIVHLDGTIEEALAQLEQINPDYRLPDDATDVAGPRGEKFIRSAISSLQRRSEQTIVETTVTKDNVTCNDTKPSNVASIVAAGVAHLRRVPGQPQAGPGPENCGRVSCSYGTAIWFCNNHAATRDIQNPFAIKLDSFKDIASMASQLSKFCSVNGSEGFSGKAFHPTDNWSVMIRDSKC